MYWAFHRISTSGLNHDEPCNDYVKETSTNDALKPIQLASLGLIILLVACSTPDVVSDTPAVAVAPAVQNAGFEQEWGEWVEVAPDGDGTAISDDSRSGSHSAKITSEVGRFEQAVQVTPESSYELEAYVQGSGQIGVIMSGVTLMAEAEDDDSSDWNRVSLPFDTENSNEIVVFSAYHEEEGRFDDFQILLVGDN